MSLTCHAAVELAEQSRLSVAEPILIEETNNTVLWLRPHAIIAKVATRTASEHRSDNGVEVLPPPIVRHPQGP
jgi:hypothetical protein